MERILSQEEIDELLSAFDDGGIEAGLSPGGREPSLGTVSKEKDAVSIDLTKGQNYSKWRIANLDIVFNSFARYYSIGLSNSLQQSVSLRKGEIVSKFFEEFLVSLNDAGVLGVFTLEPLKGEGLFVFDRTLSFGLVEMMLGASTESELVVLDREVTTIEANIVRSLMAEACHGFNRAFASLDELHSSITRVETNWKLLNILSPDTEVIQVGFSVQSGSLTGNMLMVIPYFSLEPFKEKLRNEWVQFSQSTKQSNWSKHLEKELDKLEIPLSAACGDLFLTIQEILSLGEGDIISFDYDEESPITVLADGKTKFRGQPGLRNGKKAVRIVKQVPRGE
ncbi:MAG: flagellar motor switch protein FliM [Desulfohalobiaceae bacterium]|nr:flagellar motor switch protein FliM [Desulfohalobiaceae bacterium]